MINKISIDIKTCCDLLLKFTGKYLPCPISVPDLIRNPIFTYKYLLIADYYQYNISRLVNSST